MKKYRLRTEIDNARSLRFFYDLGTNDEWTYQFEVVFDDLAVENQHQLIARAEALLAALNK